MNIIILIAILFSNYTCSQERDLLKIEYQAKTRGASKSIVMTKEKCKVGLLTDTSEIEVTSKDWDHIIELVNEIKLDKIHSLEAPSDDRSTDRKMIAVVIITLGNKVVYTSSSFDDGNPPHQLKNLIEKLFAISKIDK